MNHVVRWTIVTMLGAAACRDPVDVREAVHRALPVDGIAVGRSEHGARPITTIGGFNDPESVRYDPDQDVIFVSNIAGNPSQKDGNGYIARVAADDNARAATMAVEGGKNGVTLHTPKGMAIVGDTLWVADIDVVRGFDRTTGAPVATIQFPRPVYFLNDIAVGPDGALYVTDTGIQFDASGGMTAPSAGRIFRVEGRRAAVAVADTALAAPNGIAWDAGRQAFVVGSFAGPALLSWAPGDSTVRPIATGAGQYDGIEVVGGRVFVSSWADSSLHVLEPGSSALTRIVSGVAAPADIGVDSRRSLLLVPSFTGNRVELWSIPDAGAAPATAPADSAAADTAAADTAGR